MARHKLLLKASLAVTAIGAVVGAGGGTAQAAEAAAAPVTDPAAALAAVTGAVPYVTAVPKNLKLNPLAQTGVDPLDNGVGTQVSDFRPLDTTAMTGSLTSAPNLPVAGPLLGGLIPG
ncbi:hypothetical protein [Streptomyces sp. NPDC047097]|uniref:hypothetical protein n=1 Tax=Streptomyces sp. NPDC047097 TaxID=3155260 RepID=UPI003410A4B2